MRDLDDWQTWEQLDTPYGTAKDIPNLIRQLQTTQDKSIASELVWNYLYHQGSVYDGTLASFPHLVEIFSHSQDDEFRYDLLLALATLAVSVEMDIDFRSEFSSNELEQAIVTDYRQSSVKFKAMVNEYVAHSYKAEREDTGYFLSSYLWAQNRPIDSYIFQSYSDLEFVFLCPYCQLELWLQVDNNELKVLEDIENKLDKQTLNKISLIQDKSADLTWLNQAVVRVNYQSLSSVIPYFEGSLSCLCGHKTNVYKGILNSYFELL